jgi:ZIP family zinc transporter
METAILFAAIASSALVIGGAIGAWRPPPKSVTAGLLAFASGALITAVAVELFEDAFAGGGAARASVAFLFGATVFVVVDTWLDGYTHRKRATGGAVGFALLAAVTLDGVPENLAMGVGLVESTSATLLVIPVIVGYGALEGVSEKTLAWPLGFAAGAVLASLADTLMPEAFEESGSRPWIAYLTSLGFLLSFFVASL